MMVELALRIRYGHFDGFVVPASLGLFDHQIILLQAFRAVMPIVFRARFRACPIGLVRKRHGRAFPGEFSIVHWRLSLIWQSPAAHAATRAFALSWSGSVNMLNRRLVSPGDLVARQTKSSRHAIT